MSKDRIDPNKKAMIETLWPIIVTSTPNRISFAQDVCAILNDEYDLHKNYSQCQPTIHKDNERFFTFDDNIRDREVFIIASTEQPDENIWNLINIIDNAKTMSSAYRVTVLFTYFGYARGDRKDAPRKSVPSTTIVKCLKAVDVDRVMILDPHFSQLQSMFFVFNIKCDLLFATSILAARIAEEQYENIILSSIDSGGQKIVKDYSQRLGYPYVVVLKDKEKEGSVKVIGVEHANLKGATVIIGDDLTATLTGIHKTGQAYRERGAAKVIASLSHFVCVNSNRELLLKKLDSSIIDRYFITDSLPVYEEIDRHPKVEVVSSKRLIADVIYNTYYRLSISKLFALSKK